ncbi:SDR family NAD(P)-dependent oxidoreductase [Bradyrhizobium neotropicale]|uniref:Short-chain dehydrogenase n=1 Tax=Bradyrhizobium neotropicale TaxID=1497615 RepID=A0A176YHY4_9BRAD|nr:SDR family oxidoreductase [Bradyrhizobium neotropicale]OAF06262.1 short-chain dehydrogenase [Bradyrhizobium neotropicale]
MSAIDNLAGRLAVVTGGSNGIGAATVKRLAAAGADVIIGYHSSEVRAQELLRSLPAGRHAVAHLALEDPASFQALAAQIDGRGGKLDILVNSAGFTRAIPHHDLEALTDDLFEQILIANIRGPYSAIRALRTQLRASGDAVIVNVSSISGFTASGSNVAYCASKAALDNIGMSLGRALGPEIRVISVSPGAVATDFVPGRDREALEAGAKSTPLRRVVEADDVAAAILACATHLKVSTGTTIVVDGGRHL